LLDARIGQASGRSPVRMPTPRTVRVRASSWPRDGWAVRWRGRSPAWTPTTRIANTAVTAPDKNAAIANVTIAGGISLRRSGRLIWRPLRGLLRFHVRNFTWTPAYLPCSANAVPLHYQCNSLGRYASAVQIECSHGARRLIRLAHLGVSLRADAEVLEEALWLRQ